MTVQFTKRSTKAVLHLTNNSTAQTPQTNHNYAISEMKNPRILEKLKRLLRAAEQRAVIFHPTALEMAQVVLWEDDHV